MRVAVTGAAGFIGSHLCETLLARGRSVVAIDNFDHFYEPAVKRANIARLQHAPGFRLAELDVCDSLALRSELEDVDAVIHLAARAGVRPSFAAPTLYAQANVTATATLLDVVSELEVERLVFISSSTVYGDGAQSPFHESAELGRPKSPYAATKVAAEALCHAFAHRIPRIAILRLFSVYGPRQRPDLAIHKFARHIHAGWAIPVLGSVDSYRDYTYVEDAVAGILAALDLEQPWTVLNIASGNPIKLRDMIHHLELALGREVERKFLPPHPGDLFGTWADTRNAEKLLGLRPQWSFADGVKEFADWFLAHPAHRADAAAAA